MQKPQIKIQKPSRAKVWRADLIAACFLLPFTVLYTLFTIYPVFQGFYISFFKWNLMGKQGYVGFENYVNMFQDKYFWLALWNTTKFVIYSTPVIMISSLGLALLCNRNTMFKRLYRTVFFIPNLLSVAVISYIALFMAQPYNMGFISNLLHSMGADPEYEIFFLADPHLAWVTIVVATMWWTQGYNMMLYLSAMQDIPDRLYEAASIDGATPRQQLFYITLPMLNSTTKLILMLQLIASFKVFQQIKLITNGGPGRATRPLIMYIYEQGFTKQKMGYACAMSIILFILLAILTTIQRRVGRED